MDNIPSPGSVVTEHSLLTFTNSSTLDEALEILIETSKDEHGRLHLASEKLLPVVLVLAKSLIEPPHRQHLFSCLKLLRNLCAGEILNQNSFIKEKGVDIISIVFSSVNFYSNSESDYEIIRIGLQLLGNVSLAGKEHQTAVWDRFFPTGFADIARVRRLEICAPLCMILYTCCNGNHERVVEICGVSGLQIFSKMISTASTGNSVYDSVGFREDWLQWLLVKICFEESHFSSLFSELSSTGAPGCSDDRKSTDNHFTTENSFLLSVLSESLNQQLNEITVHKEFPLCILGILRRVVGVVDFFSRGTSGLPTDSAAVDVLGYSITILRDICAQDKRNLKTKGLGNEVTDSLISAGLVDLILDLLRDLEPPSTIKKSISSSEDQVGKAASSSLKVCPYKGFRRDIVAVIGNCLFRSKHLQDEIRKKGDILLLLQQCVTDEDNEFLREWGIWTVRNLLEGNEENQRQVEELELQGSADVPILAGLGLRVEVDKLTRRAKLVNAQ